MLVNVAANYVLIFGHLGFPATGIRGAAYGTLFGSLCGLLVLLAAIWRQPIAGSSELALPRYDGEVMRKLLRFGYPAGVELFLNLRLHQHDPSLPFHGLATATAVTIVFNWDMVSFVPLLGIQIGVVSLVGRYMGAGRPGSPRVTRSGLKMGWSTRRSSWSSSSASPNNWSRSFSPAARTPSFPRRLLSPPACCDWPASTSWPTR